MNLADVVTAVQELPEMVGEPNDGGRSLVRRTDVLDILAGYAYASATADLDRRDLWEALRDDIAGLAWELTRSPNGPADFRGEVGSVIARHRADIEADIRDDVEAEHVCDY